jgi:hypothetical protein
MTTILIKKKDTAGAPAPGDLTNAAGGTEIAVNTATRRIYTKDSGGNVVELGNNATSSTIADLTVTNSTTLSYGTANQVQYLNASKLLVGSANLTFDGTTLTPSALTVTNAVTLTGGTANGVTYLNGSKVLTSGSALTFDGTNLGLGTSTINTYYDRTQQIYGTASSSLKLTNATAGTANTDGFDVALSGTTALLYNRENGDMAFGVNNVEGMRLTSTGLGIGTSSPSTKLEVSNGAITGGAGGYVLYGKNSSSFPSTGLGYFALVTNNVDATNGGMSVYTGNSSTGLTEKMRVDSSGNVGIGTTSPAYPLDVVASSGAVGISLRGRSADNIGTFSFFTNNGVTNDAQLQMRPNDNELRFLVSGARFQSFYTNGSERMRIDASGSVGIGASTSDAKLVVSGGAATTGIVARFVNPSSGANAKIGFSDTLTYNWTAGATGADFTFINGEYGTNPGTERVIITSGGNVGIATNNPTIYGKLAVRAGITVTAGSTTLTGTSFSASDAANSTFWITHASATTNLVSDAPMAFWTTSGSGVSEKARINADGTLQVGRTGGSSPDGKLQVGATGTGAGAANTKLGFALIEDDSGNGAGLWLGSMTNENTGVIGSRTSTGNIAFQTYNGGWGERMRLTYTGNLLVGTTSTAGSVSNYAGVIGGAFKSFGGSVSTTSGTAATLFTAPTGFSSYLITVWIGADDVNNYQLVASVNTQPGGAAKITTLVSASLLTVSLSGYNVQATQSSGGAATVNYHAVRIAA